MYSYRLKIKRENLLMFIYLLLNLKFSLLEGFAVCYWKDILLPLRILRRNLATYTFWKQREKGGNSSLWAFLSFLRVHSTPYQNFTSNSQAMTTFVPDFLFFSRRRLELPSKKRLNNVWFIEFKYIGFIPFPDADHIRIMW